MIKRPNHRQTCYVESPGFARRPQQLNIDRCINLSGPFKLQSPQVDLLGKSEIFDGVAVVCDATGVTLLGDSGGMLSQKILKTGGS